MSQPIVCAGCAELSERVAALEMALEELKNADPVAVGLLAHRQRLKREGRPQVPAPPGARP